MAKFTLNINSLKSIHQSNIYCYHIYGSMTGGDKVKQKHVILLMMNVDTPPHAIFEIF